jgi:hypothetical protein
MYGKSGCGSQVLAVRHIEDVREVINQIFLTDLQFSRNLAVALATDNQLEHSSLSYAQPSWKRE